MKQDRRISFEEIILHINNGNLLAKLDHPSRTKYPHQQIFVVLVEGYVYMVPFIEDNESYFLKTIIPSRKWTKKFLKKEENNDETE